MNIISVSEMNRCARNDKKKFISDSENKYSESICSISEKIYKNHNLCPIVLISGPSGSGKTTSAKRIAQRLLDMGIKSHAISLDDYYLPNGSPKIPYNSDGTPDLESPYRLDIDLLKEHFSKILNNEEIIIPKFDFTSQSRVKGMPYKRQTDEITIIEGIHALNPVISESITNHSKKIYISIRTRIKLEDTKLIHPSVIRLMRRLSRDILFRGKDIEDVFKMFESVSYGEKKYINPFKKYADYEFDTFFAYEVMIYKNILYNKIKSKRDALYKYENFKNIIKTFDDINEISDHSLIPSYSLIREFIGESLFTY